MNLIEIDYQIDKNKWSGIFYDNIQDGQWHWSVPQRRELFWYQLMMNDKHPLRELTKDVEQDLNIYGMDNFPRFSYQFPNTVLGHHKDEDDMVSININLLETTPTIHIEHEPYPYECALIRVGQKMHGVEKDPNHRLVLKFCLRHSYDEVYERLDKFGLLLTSS